MKHIPRKLTALLLAVVLTVSTFTSLTASAARVKRNTKTSSDSITVSASSNFAPTVTETFDASTEQITVTYWVNCSRRMINNQWILRYDPNILKLDETEGVNIASDPDSGKHYLIPRVAESDSVVKVLREGEIRGNCSHLAGFALQNANGDSVPLITVTFNPVVKPVTDNGGVVADVDIPGGNDVPAVFIEDVGSIDTGVYLEMEVLGVEDGSNFKSLIKDSQIVDRETKFVPDFEPVTITPGTYDDYLLYYNSLSSMSLDLLNETGDAVADGYTVNWYEQGSDKVIGTGKTIYVRAGTYTYDVVFDKELSFQYMEPQNGTVTVGDDDISESITLQPYGNVTLHGDVKNETGKTIPNAKVSVKQTFNDVYIKNEDVSADADGAFSKSIKNTEAYVTVSADGYVDTTYKLTYDDMNSGDYTLHAVLKELPPQKITLDVSRLPAVKAGETALAETLSNGNGLRFTVKNKTANTELKNVTVQYPYIILGDEQASDAQLEITAEDSNQKLLSGSAVISSSRLDSDVAKITMKQKGYLSLRATGSDNSVLMIFDQDGKYVSSQAFEGSAVDSGELSAGNYTGIVVTKSNLLTKVASLSVLQDYGLVSGTDYAEFSFAVKDNEITPVTNIEVPKLNEEKLLYTVPENTSFTSNYTEVTAGRYNVFRLEYEIDPKYQTDNQTVTVELPEGTAFVPGSLSLNNKATAVGYQNNRVTVKTDSSEGVIRFYAYAANVGSVKLNASLSFTKDNESITQPLGSVAYNVTAQKINAPEQIRSKTIPVSGSASADSDIILYDNGKKVGETKTNLVGTWSYDYVLTKPYSFSLHSLYAVAKNEKLGLEVKTDTVEVIYDESCVELSSITMYNTAFGSIPQVTVFDFTKNEKQVPSYSHYYGCPAFTFKVAFAGDSSKLENVYVVTENGSGAETYIECTYNQSQNVWVGSHDFPSVSDAPVKVNAAYDDPEENYLSDYDFDLVTDEDINEEAEDIKELSKQLDNELESKLDCEDYVEKENGISCNIKCEGEPFAHYDLEFSELDDDFLTKWEGKDYYQLKDENGNLFAYQLDEFDNGTMYEYVAYPEDKVMEKNSLKLAVTKNNKGGDSVSAGIDSLSAVGSDNEFWDFLRDFAGSITPGVGEINALIEEYGRFTRLKGLINTYAAMLDHAADELEKLIDKKVCPCEYALSDKDRAEAKEVLNGIRAEIKDYKKLVNTGINTGTVFNLAMAFANMKATKVVAKQLGRWFNKYKQWKANILKYDYYLGNLGRRYFKQMNIISENLAERLENDIYNNVRTYIAQKMYELVVDFEGYIHKRYKEIFDEIMEEIKKVKKLQKKKCSCDDSCECGCKKNPPNPKPQPKNPPKPANPKYDPSGYVYEAVPSNRVEGVKAEIYYLGYALDEFGIPEENQSDILWKAEEYDQINPMYTNSNGEYGWDVPEGKWLVKYTKDGYYDTDSKLDPACENSYIPVLPIQTEINTAIVSKAKPTVETVHAYENEVLINFSQYMSLDTVNTGNVRITQNGRVINGTLEAVNAEYNYQKTEQFASKFRFVPVNKLNGTVSVDISGVKNYNNAEIERAYTVNADIEYKPEEIRVERSTRVKYGAQKEINISIYPAKAGANKTLTVRSIMNDIVSVSSESVKADSNGNAKIVISGNLPGASVISISLDGTDVSAEVSVSVDDPLNNSVLIGDVNDDGIINGADAGVLSRYTSGWKDYEEKIKNPAAADVNADGKINGADAGFLSRYVSGWMQYARYFE